MKKRISYLLIAALSLSACGAGSDSASKKVETSTTVKTRNGVLSGLGGLAGNMGTGMLTSLATNAIGMGLAAIPGMPKEIAGLFGGGGADNTEVLAALADIKKLIEGLDKKIDTVQASLNDLTANVAALNEKVDMVARNLCGATTTIKTAPLTEVMTFVNSDWRDLFGDEGAARQALANSITSGLKYSAADEKAIFDIYSRISKNYKFKYTQAIFGDVLLSKTGQRGLIAQIEACTLTQKRFLTSVDSQTWRAYVDSFIYSQFKALQVELFVIGFESYLEAKNAATVAGVAFDTDSVVINTRSVAKVVSEFLANASAELLMVSNTIPAGQVVDTATRKVWTAPTASYANTLAAAMSQCVVNSATFSNTRSIFTPTGIVNEAINPCPSNTGLDGVGVTSDTWRIPALWEVSNSMLLAQKTDWYTSSMGVGLLDSGSNGVAGFSNANGSNNCGPGGTSGTPCTTGAQYLTALGAGALVKNLPADVSAVWTNTSYAATWKTAAHPANRTAANGQISLVNSVFKSTNSYNSIAPGDPGINPEVASGGWRHDTWVERAISNTCIKEPSSRYNGAMVPCLNLWNGDDQNDRCIQLRNDEPILHGITQAHVVNIGANVVNRKVMGGTSNYSVPAVWGGVAPFATGKYYVSQSRVDHAFLCEYYWKDWTGSWGMGADFRNYLPQEAATLLVRDLAPNEMYYFLDGDNATFNSVAIRQKSEAPTLLILPTDSSFRIDTFSTFGNSLTVRCTVVPASSGVVPTLWSELQENCPRATDTLLPLGSYNVYAMAYDTVSKIYTPMMNRSASIVGPAPLLPTKITISAGINSATAAIATMQSVYKYAFKLTAADGSNKTCSIDIAVGSCGITALPAGTAYKASIVVTSGPRVKESTPQTISAVAAPTTTTTTTTIAPIPAPAQPVVSARDASVVIQPRPSTDASIVGYDVFNESGKSVCTIQLPAVSCTVTGLQNGFPYAFTMVAITKTTRSLPTALTTAVTPLPIPLAPSGVVVTSKGNVMSIAITANPLSSAAGTFTVKAVNGAEELTCSAPALTASCNIDGITRGAGYLVTAVAVNDSGTSPATSRKFVSPPLPEVPVIAEATASDSTLYIDLDVSKASPNTERFFAVASPGNKTCEIMLPASGCTLAATNGTSYIVSIVAITDSGEKSAPAKTNALRPAAPPAPEPVVIATKAAVVQQQPTQKEIETAVAALPAPTQSNVPKGATSIAVGETFSTSAIKSALGGKFSKASGVKLKVASSSASVCSASGAGVKGKASGYCVINVSATVKSAGKKITIKQPLTVAVVG